MTLVILLLLALSGLSSVGWAEPSQTGKERSAYSSNGDARLDALVQESLDRNPAISQAFARYRAAVQRLPQVSALPDPMLAFTNYLRTPETRVGSQTNAITLSQQFPWFGILSTREQVAAKEAAIAREQYEASKDQVVQQVKTAYYTLAFIDLALDINNQDRLLLEHYEKLAEARYQQGMGLQQAVVKLQAEITRVENTLEQLRARRVDAEAVINALRNRVPGTAIPKVILPPVPPATIDYPQLYETGRKNRPEILGALLGIERDEKRIDLARKSYWPSFNVGGTFVNVIGRPVAPGAMPIDSNGMNVFSVNLGISLPVHRGKYDAEVAEATEQKAASMHGYQNAVNMVEASIREAGFRIETLRGQILLFNSTLMPQARQSLQSAEAAYSTGSLGVLDLLDSERVLLEVRLGLAQYTSDYMKSLADLERAIGAPFPEVKP
jgi:cobalt-zinc-cadmium efflux system outer membrane protein